VQAIHGSGGRTQANWRSCWRLAKPQAPAGFLPLSNWPSRRVSELLTMHWDDLDLEARTVLLRTTKNGLPRMVPLSPRALNVLQDMPRSGPTVFTISANALRLA